MPERCSSLNQERGDAQKTPPATTLMLALIKRPSLQENGVTHLVDTKIHERWITRCVTLHHPLPIPNVQALVDQVSCHVQQLHPLVHLEARSGSTTRSTLRGNESGGLPDTDRRKLRRNLFPSFPIDRNATSNGSFEL